MVAGTFRIVRVGSVFGVPKQSSALAAGTWVEADGTAAEQGEMAIGVIVDDTMTDNPAKMVNVYGNGSIIEDTAASYTQGTHVWLAAAGVLTQTEPAAGAGVKITLLGTALSTTQIFIAISVYQDQA